ncbi:MAG TPA: ABC transporter permease [Flexilinea sp.]|nr:ABC transporter permease [Flexilinea sp.]HOG22355.1 ABC transporter permease [Flexilinea sp.]HOU19916.1 ABC transporter permease [Flexilinea sp.]HPG21027.1 ABC transporter permease [Flexilinea sp.]HQF80778.1 ABC transporter permease [Flexilinea sp.]
MARYTARRLLQAIIVIFGITIAAFSINFLAGDPTYVLIGDMRGMTEEDIQAFRHRMGFDRPILVQYFDWLKNAVRGDFGWSYKYKEDNWKIIVERFPATLQLTVVSLILQLLVSFPLGVFAALKRGTKWDSFSMVLALLGQSMPSFWIGLMLMMIFSVNLKWLPVSGRYEGIRSMVLPVITLSFYGIARNTRLIRSSMLEVLGEDYIRTARAKGQTERNVYIKHALRNVLIPVVTMVGMDLGSLLSGALVVETIFAWPGMGMLTVNAINGKDIMMVQACVTLFALMFVFANLLVDFTYTILDPRVRLQ